ncbi:MAG: DNA translocase FtsK [Treponema sp.]|nr:DNA translocase FtsK [Treponema sp.]
MRFIDNFKHRFSTDARFKFRSISVFLAIFLGILSILTLLSLLPSLFGIRIFPIVPGIFFTRSFGVLALLIPVYLAFAAIILADSTWKPDRIYLLNGFVLPFLTLSFGFAFIRDFDIRSLQYAFLNYTGKTVFSMLIISLTVIEVVVLMALRNVFFLKDNQKPRYRKKPLLLPAADPLPVISNLNAIEPSQSSSQNSSSAEPPGVSFFGDISSPGNIYSENESAPDSEEELDELTPPVYVLGEETDYLEQTSDLNDDTFTDESENNFDDAVDIDDLTTNTNDIDDPDIDADNLDDADDTTDDTDDTANDIDDLVDIETGDPDDDADDIDAALTDVKRSLEEAEAAAVLHSEQARKKETKPKKSPYKKYKIPVDILNEYPDGEYWIIDQATRDAAVALKDTLEEFKIQAEVTGIRKGPVITMFEILPAPGVKLSKIVGLQDNIALRLAASSVRIVAPIPGKHAVGIEVPNAKRNIVSFREIIEGELKRSGDKMGIPIVMGKDITGEAQTVDLVQMPHLLIAGATGSGKSVCVNSIILSVLYQLHPAECRLMLIDPKIVELKLYNDIPHLLTPVITEPKKAFQALQYCIYEMERRYACLDKMGVRDIRSYNRRIKERNLAQEHLPYIVVIIDEFADLMTTTGKELESTVARLAAMSRAVGIHLVLATQRPSIDVITGLIKANIPSRIAFMVASKMDSRIIIDMVGAEKLLGKGDMLYSGVVDPFPIRMQGAFISEEEVEAVVEHVKTFGAPDYIDDEIFFEDEEDETNMSLFSDGDDPLYEKALEIIMQQGKASASFIQRRLKIGFNRAARLIEEMERRGVVGPSLGAKPREVLRGSALQSYS